MNPERIDELIQKCVLGIQTESETRELSDFLEQDSSTTARRKLRLALKADAYLQEAAAEIGDESNGSDSLLARKNASLKRQLWTQGGIAAAIMIGFFAWFVLSGASQAESELGVATVLRIEGQGLANQDRMIARGDALLAGDQLKMEQGLIELVFRDTGVHAIATAPLSFTAESSERIFLHNGDIKLHVPPQGIGFVVETTEREITDLGTSFVVTARALESRVLVLDGEISVGSKNGNRGGLMTEGEMASFSRGGTFSLLRKKIDTLPERSFSATDSNTSYLSGMILGFNTDVDVPDKLLRVDLMGQRVLPLIKSGFENRDSLEGLKRGQPLRFSGIAGAYKQFANRAALEPFEPEAGWLSWYHGKVAPPKSGRYRFWGYADNNLMVAIDGKPVFDGSRYDSAWRANFDIERKNFPAWPCINAPAGFAVGPWVELGEESVQLDILFGEKSGNLTSGLLLVEREGDLYETTSWGQPKWPLFLTQEPKNSEREELDAIRAHMEEKLMGSFSVSTDAVWHVEVP